MAGKITLTSKLGSFVFDSHVILSKAKLIRDSITGQFYNPQTDAPKVKTVDDVKDYIEHHVGGHLGDIPFDFSFKF